MSKHNPKAPITDLLKRMVLEAVETGRTTFRGIEQETGVKRQSLMKFARGEQSLRGDMMDKLAVYFGLELRAKRKKG